MNEENAKNDKLKKLNSKFDYTVDELISKNKEEKKEILEKVAARAAEMKKEEEMLEKLFELMIGKNK